MNNLLQLSEVSACYGQSQALFGVDLQVGEGEAVALLGRNGMGKTTTIRTICQMMPNSAGELYFAGQRINGLPAHKVARLGIGLVPEGRRCFAGLSVLENLLAAARGGPWDFKAVSRLFPRLAERKDQAAQTLSGGEQQMLAIGRALMTNPRLLILDEATEGLAPVVRQEIWQALLQLRQQGQALLVVDKNLSELRPMIDRCVILEKGRSAWTGLPEALTTEIEDQYLGV